MFFALLKSFIGLFKNRPNIVNPLPIPPTDSKFKNRKALLDTIAWAEGTSEIPNSDDGYRALVGGGTFDSYAAHPNKAIWIQKIHQFSTAAGRYQLMARYYEPYCKMLDLKDFSPASQDKIAIQQIKEVDALSDIDAGYLTRAIEKCGKRWASLPNSPLGQSIRTVAQVKDVYSNSGGSFAA